MKIRKKVFTIILALLLISIIGVCTIDTINVLRNVKLREKTDMTKNMNHINYLIHSSLNSLNSISGDWAQWDDTLEFVKTNNSTYIKTNLNDVTFSDLKINAFIILDTNNKIKYSNFYDIQNKESVDMPQEILNYIKDNKEITCNNKNVLSIVSGIISVNGKPMMISSRPITDSEIKSPTAGTLIIGKYMDYDLINEIEKLTDSKIKIEKINEFRVSNKEIAINNGQAKFSNEDSIIIEPTGKNEVTAYSIIKGLDEQPLFTINMESERKIYNEGIKSISILILLLVAFTIIPFTLCIILLQIFVIRPIENISNEVSKINLTDRNISRVSTTGDDEIAILGIEINDMLEKIETNNKKVVDSEKQLKLVLEGASAGFWDWDLEKDILYVNEKFSSILGYLVDELPMSSEVWKKLIHEDDLKYCNDFFFSNLGKNLDFNIMEQRLLSKSGDYKWILSQCKVVEYNKEGKPKRMTGIVTDISEKKKYEEELKYLTYYDKLTGIFNRGYYEFILQKIDKNGKLPVSIIMGDLNGLKLTNDTLGYEEGDKLLKETADILKKACGSNAIISRYGGDEFIIVLENVNEQEADKTCVKIKNQCKKKKVGLVYLNIALGYSTKISKDQDIKYVIKEAEEMMYRNKLLEGRSARNSIISSLTQTLAEKSNETEEHVKRMYNLCVKISYILNLTTNEIDELYLLARLHDIGKIGIDDKILNKTGKLTEEEWVVMKTHPEIGYRIASSTPDLRHIAYKILTHHERYDGTGYPKGLKGEEIPLLSRILAIVDSFDVMTHDRPYKNAMTIEEAITELKKCSGTQFDSNLVEIFIQAIQKS